MIKLSLENCLVFSKNVLNWAQLSLQNFSSISLTDLQLINVFHHNFIPNSLKYRSNSATYCALPYFYIISLKAYLVPSMTSFSNRKAVKAKVHSFMPKASLHLRLALSLLCHLQLNGIFSGGAIHNFINIVTIR